MKISKTSSRFQHLPAKNHIHIKIQDGLFSVQELDKWYSKWQEPYHLLLTLPWLGFIATAEAASHAAGVPGQTRSWALTDAQQMMGTFADALVLDRQVSSAKARQVLDWQPQEPSLFDELKRGVYAMR
jgi:hypothetical protein